MPSLRHHALVLVLQAMRRRRIYASVEGLQRGIAQVRRAGPAAPRASGTALTVQRRELAGHPVFTLAPARPAQPPRPVLYLHGGGYVRPITRHHWGFLEWLVRTTGCEVTVPLYPLAPESTCLDTLAWVTAVHAQLAARHAPQAIHLMGDSAGGGLALALAQSLRDAGQPRAAQILRRRGRSPPRCRADGAARPHAGFGGRARGGASVCRGAAFGPPGGEPCLW